MSRAEPGLYAHAQGEVTRLCHCWILQTVSGDKTGFTDHDEDIILQDTICHRNSGLTPSAVEEGLGFKPDIAEVSGALRSDHLTERDIASGRYDDGKITTFLVNWADPSQHLVDRVARVGEITRKDGIFHMELLGLSASLDQTSGRHFSAACHAVLGDRHCGIDLDPARFSALGDVVSVHSPGELDVQGLATYAADWFRHGHLVWLSGANAERHVSVLEHLKTSDRVTLRLWQSPPFEVRAGDRFRVIAGCDKRFATCKEKFANSINFQGFPHMPGNRFALGYAANQEALDGGAIVL